MKRLAIAALLLVGCYKEAAPCDKATLLNLVATCGPTKEDCHKAIDEREKLCRTRIIEEEETKK